MPRTKSNIIEIFSDASLSYGAWVNRKGRQRTFDIPKKFQYSSFASEFYAAQQAIKDNAHVGNRIHLHCDNQGVCTILKDRRTAHPVKHANIEQGLQNLFNFVDDHNIRLSISHINSKSNPADVISHRMPSESERSIATEQVQNLYF